jgi:hypothetical protein
MLKAGKPKATFEKAIEEIESYIQNPEVSSAFNNFNKFKFHFNL